MPLLNWVNNGNYLTTCDREVHMYGKSLVLTACFALLVSSVGCAKKETIEQLDDEGKVIGVKTINRGFWESENASNYYDFEAKRVDKNAENVEKKINAITKHATLAMADAETSNEKVLINLLAMTQVNNIPTTPPSSGVQAPRTAVDLWGQNMIGMGNLALAATAMFLNNNGDDYRDSSRDRSPSIENSGSGDVFYMSDYNKNPNYMLSTAGESSLTTGFELGSNHNPSTVTSTNETFSTVQDGSGSLGSF